MVRFQLTEQMRDVDGLINLEHPRMRTSVMIQVKRKKQLSLADVTATLKAVDRTGALMGLLITLNPVSEDMLVAAGRSRKQFDGKSYPKLAILTYDEVTAGKYANAVPYEYAIDVGTDGNPV